MAKVQEEKTQQKHAQEGRRKQNPAHRLVHLKRGGRRKIRESTHLFYIGGKREVVGPRRRGYNRGPTILARRLFEDPGELFPQALPKTGSLIGYHQIFIHYENALARTNDVVSDQCIRRTSRAQVEQSSTTDQPVAIFHREAVYEVVRLGV